MTPGQRSKSHGSHQTPVLGQSKIEPVRRPGFDQLFGVQAGHQRFITVPIPAFTLRLLVGEMAVELLLNGQRVVPTALHRAGFTFLFPELDTALEDILK